MIWAIVSIVYIGFASSKIINLILPDPDDTLRLIQVRDLLAGQGWYDLHQHRIDPASGGVPMHWSRLVDVPIAAAILILSPLLGQPLAEQAALVIIPLLTLAIVMVLVGRIACLSLGARAVPMSCLALGVAVRVMSQLVPMRIDHHGWQIVAVLVAINALLGTRPKEGGWIAGSALASGLSVSLEGLPFTVVFCAMLAMRWLRSPDQGQWLVSTIHGLALTSLLLFAATRGLADLAIHCDAISPLHLIVFTWAAIGLTALSYAHVRHLAVLVGAFGLIAIGAAAIYWAAAPRCITSTFDMIDPLTRKFWYDNVAEGKPIWFSDGSKIVDSMLPPLCALIAAVALALRGRADQRGWWRDYAILLAGATAVSFQVMRASALAGAMAVIPLAWLLIQASGGISDNSSPSRKLMLFFAMITLLMPSIPYGLASRVYARDTEMVERGAGTSNLRISKCRIAKAAPELQKIPPATIFAPLDIGPELLLHSPHAVVATGHHRAGLAMRDVIAAFLSSPDQARGLLSLHKAQYLAFCPDLVEPSIYSAAAHKGLAADLMANRVPSWLEPVQMPGNVGLKLWKVKLK